MYRQGVDAFLTNHCDMITATVHGQPSPGMPGTPPATCGSPGGGQAPTCACKKRVCACRKRVCTCRQLECACGTAHSMPLPRASAFECMDIFCWVCAIPQCIWVRAVSMRPLKFWLCDYPLTVCLCCGRVHNRPYAILHILPIVLCL